MGKMPELTEVDRYYRREDVAKFAKANRDKSSRYIGKLFGLSDSYVRQILRQKGLARPVGARGK